MKRLTSTLILALAITTLTSLHAQITVGVEVLEGNADYTTCTDPFDDPDPGWGVQVEGQGWVYFDGHHTFCSFPSLPYLIYQQTYPVAATLPDSIEVCFMTGEHDPNFLFFINCDYFTCVRTMCKKFKLPPIGSEIIEELVLSGGSVSGGYTKVRIFVEGEPVMVDVPKCILTESYGTVPQDTSKGNDIVVNDDGSSVIAGTWNSKAYVMRIDADGEMMTFRNLGPLIGDGKSKGLAIEKVAAGGYAVAGEWVEITPTDTFTRVFLLRLDENLDPIPGIPVLILGAEGIYQNGNRHSPVLLALPDGVLLATSIVLGGGLNWEDIALTKYSFDLSPQWTTFHSTGFFEAATGLVQTSQGFAMTIDRAFLNSKVVRRVSDTGIGLDNTMVTALNINDLEYDPANDKLLAVGITFPQDSTRTVIYRLDANTGTLEDSTFIKHGINNVPADIVRCDDGNMLIGINTSQPGAFGGYFWSVQFFTINPSTFEVLAQDSMVNSNSLISNLLSRIQPLNCDGSRRVATGHKGFWSNINTFYYRRKFCSDKITSSNSLCAGETVTLTAPADGTSYLWSTGETTPEITVNTPGQYWVKVTYGCDSLSDTIQLEQLAPPLAAFNYSVDNLTVTFSDSSQYATTWLWNFGDGTTSTEPEPEHTFAADGLYSVVLIASNDCGSDTASTTIEVGSTPTADFSASDTLGCAPFTVQFTNLSSANATSFLWTFEGGNPATSTEANPTVTFENPGSFDVTLVASNALGSFTLIAPDYIRVLDLPTAAFSANANGLSVSFSNASQNATTWLWNFGDGTTSTEPEPEHTFAADGLYSVVLIASNDCGSDTASTTIEVGSTPTADFSASDTLGCAPFTVQFTNLSSANATSFLWTFEGGNPATSTEANPTVTFENPGWYDVKLKATNALGTSTLLIENYIHVLGAPTANFTFETDGLTVSFTDVSSNATSWEWEFGDGETSTEQHPVHTYAAPGEYSVLLTVHNECGMSSIGQKITVEPNATLEELGLERFIVYPNPNDGRFTLQLETVKNLSCRILIANVLGEVILQDAIDAAPGSTQRQYELNNVPSGMYFLQLQAGGKTALHRLVIAK